MHASLHADTLGDQSNTSVVFVMLLHMTSLCVCQDSAVLCGVIFLTVTQLSPGSNASKL